MDGRRLALTNLEKELYPSGFTKAAVIDYYARIAPVMLAHLADRPLTLKRYPNGTTAGHFFEKQCPRHRPTWVRTAVVPRKRGADGVITYCLASDRATLVWLANLAAIELHPLLACAQDVGAPRCVVFDLDPGPPADIVDCCRVAMLLRERLAEDGLEAWPKTSGSKGVQLYVPLNTPHSYQDTKPYAHRLAKELEARHPHLVVERMDKSIRSGKVLIDWSQNHDTKTTVSVYSLRARETPTVSTPISWEELSRAAESGRPEALHFEAPQVLARVQEKGDLFEPVARAQQVIPGRRS